jgi:hypothetical protein
VPDTERCGPDLKSAATTVLSTTAHVPIDGLLACEISHEVTANTGGSSNARMGVGLMRGTGASFDVEDDEGGGTVESRSKDDALGTRALGAKRAMGGVRL